MAWTGALVETPSIVRSESGIKWAVNYPGPSSQVAGQNG
jgi:hypothetical protein